MPKIDKHKSRANTLKDLKSTVSKINHIQDLGSFEREINYIFTQEKTKRDNLKRKIFKPGDKVRFLHQGFAENGTVNRILNKNIEIKFGDGSENVFVCPPSRMGLIK